MSELYEALRESDSYFFLDIRHLSTVYLEYCEALSSSSSNLSVMPIVYAQCVIRASHDDITF